MPELHLDTYKTVIWAVDIFAVYLQIFKKSCELSRGMMLNHREQSFAWKMSQNYALWGTKSWGLLLTPTKSMKLVHFMIGQVRVFWVKIVRIGLACRPYFHGWYFVLCFAKQNLIQNPLGVIWNFWVEQGKQNSSACSWNLEFFGYNLAALAAHFRHFASILCGLGSKLV